MVITYIDNKGIARKVYEANAEEELGVDVAIDFFTQAHPDCEFEINEAEKKGNYKDVWDLVVKIPNKKALNVEINVKKDWRAGLDWKGRDWTENSSEDYPFIWNTMDYLWRKNDNEGKRNLPTHHMTVGGDYKRIFFNPRANLSEDSIKLKWCKNTRQEEPFYMCKLPAKGSFFAEKNSNGDWLKVYQCALKK